MLKFEELKDIAFKIDYDLFGNIRTEDLLKYMLEEIEELKEATNNINNGSDCPNIKLNQIEELGDVVFCILAFCRQNNIDINDALSLTLIKLKDRLKHKDINGKLYKE